MLIDTLRFQLSMIFFHRKEPCNHIACNRPRSRFVARHELNRISSLDLLQLRRSEQTYFAQTCRRVSGCQEGEIGSKKDDKVSLSLGVVASTGLPYINQRSQNVGSIKPRYGTAAQRYPRIAPIASPVLLQF
jgi:hypothetical protein